MGLRESLGERSSTGRGLRGEGGTYNLHDSIGKEYEQVDGHDGKRSGELGQQQTEEANLHASRA
jgi:hypothetical protein